MPLIGYIGLLYAVKTFFIVPSWKNVEKEGKTAVFPGGYGRIGEILHGRLWPDWGNTAWAAMAGLGSIGLM